jgi:glyoxylase-like metal-dependent hydrolase (beta-lactamase superfamily II)
MWWSWACLPHQVRRSDWSVKDVTGYLAYQVHPDHAGLVDEVIAWYDGTAADIERTLMPSAADEFALQRWAAHGYETDPASLGDAGSWTQLNERALTDVEQPVLPDGFRFRTADEAGPGWSGAGSSCPDGRCRCSARDTEVPPSCGSR